MALPISVTYTFATATSAIPLSQLDANFTTVVNGINGIGNGTNSLSNVVITGGTIDGTTIGATTSSTGRFSTVTATTLNAATHRSDTSLTFQTNGTTTAMTIDTSQNVGIGTTSPGGTLDVNGTITARCPAGGTGLLMRGRSSDNLSQVLGFDNGVTTLYGQLQFGSTGGGITTLISNGATGYTNFLTNGSERARIDSSGNVLFNTTDATLYNNTSGYGVCYRVNASFDILSTSDNAVILNRTGTDGSIEEFRKSGTIVGSISVTGSATAYNTSSDYRLKNSVEPMTTGLVTVAALKPVTYKWNADNSDGEGFIAHELQSVIPHAVTGEKDAVNEDGSIKPQGVDYSKIVVHLVAAIQELKAEIDALKGTA